MKKNIIEFVRKKDFELVKELGQGACGKTVLLYDDVIEEQFVCKKYLPLFDEDKELLFKNFVQEIKLLHLVYHQNVVRVFSYHMYPEHHTGYILMEYINGYDIEEYLEKYPQNINEVFLQTIEGFRHLESNNILHRDIRPQNIMVREDGTVKIIDFGFGKQVFYESDFDKSISLNWWCVLPNEFSKQVYDFKTEIYFVGKLFEKLLIEQGIEHFKYKNMLSQMCQSDPNDRTQTFFEINKDIQSNRFSEIDFDYGEIQNYRTFSDHLFQLISKIEHGTKYVDNIEKIQVQIEDLYKKCMLEENVIDTTTLIRCFVNGTYFYYHTKFNFPVYVIKGFIDLIRSCSIEKKNIILSNIHTKLDSISRYEETPFDDDIPF